MSEIINLLIALIIVTIFLLILMYALNTRQVIVLEYERGLLYRSGKFKRVLPAGRYWYNRLLEAIYKVDTRSRAVSIIGQEILSSDNVGIKISLAATFKIEDPYRAINTTNNYQEALYLMLQLHLRDLVAALPIDELLAKRKEISDALFEAAKPPATELGLALLSVGIKDIMFPGELKNIFAQVVNARKEGLAALERARGESAALRNLANSAKLLENNPALLQLRLLQTLNTNSGNTIMLKLPEESEVDVLPKQKSKPQRNQPK
jgi:regulator of protease activity HflC (stomatin/prohibitin superfamily)